MKRSAPLLENSYLEREREERERGQERGGGGGGGGEEGRVEGENK